jgi:hypothetical protein
MSRSRTIHVLSFAIAIVALAVGIYQSRGYAEMADELVAPAGLTLIAPAGLAVFLMAIALICTLKEKYLKSWVCLLLDIGILINLIASITVSGQFSERWMELAAIAPSFILTAFVAVLMPVAYWGARFDRLLLAIFTVFTTLTLSSLYAQIYNFYCVVLAGAAKNEDLPSKLANYDLNQQSATMLVLSIIFSIVVFYTLKRKGIKLMTAKRVREE